MTDFLEDSVLLDESQYQEGFKDGYKDGLMHMSGKFEGTKIGLQNGFYVGEELGFYQGCVYVWRSAVELNHEHFSARVRKNIDKLELLVRGCLCMEYGNENENENVEGMMESLRLQFRLVCANMGVRLEYKGQRISSSEEF